ncbi:MAG: pseudouridine-5'-phosphate glycosidase [Bacteroidota bacterium]
MPSLIQTSTEVAEALATNQAVVALESTIITHGMPYPQNLETALRVEETVREQGAVPATIAMVDGIGRAGLVRAELETLAKLGPQVTKCSRRDIPYLISQKKHGATTVAATMILAAKAGISIFATGGIGGVHPGVADTWDISADLQELAQTNVAVVCAGAKSILDLPKTLEYLETVGVPVIGYQTEEFPAFFTRRSGLKVEINLNSPSDIARLLRAKWDFGLQGGVLVANPIPLASEPDYAHLEKAIKTAQAQAQEQRIQGKALTPFLLDRIEKETQGESLKANIQLVLNNARLAAKIARAYAQL